MKKPWILTNSGQSQSGIVLEEAGNASLRLSNSSSLRMSKLSPCTHSKQISSDLLLLGRGNIRKMVVPSEKTYAFDGHIKLLCWKYGSQEETAEHLIFEYYDLSELDSL